MILKIAGNHAYCHSPITLANSNGSAQGAVPMNGVTQVPAATSEEAMAHFEESFRFETDCWDVHSALQSDGPGFVLLDVRNDEEFARGHVPGAIHLPHGKIIASKMARWPQDTLFVTYCDGPHCNGAARGAIRL